MAEADYLSKEDINPLDYAISQHTKLGLSTSCAENNATVKHFIKWSLK